MAINKEDSEISCRHDRTKQRSKSKASQRSSKRSTKSKRSSPSRRSVRSSRSRKSLRSSRSWYSKSSKSSRKSKSNKIDVEIYAYRGLVVILAIILLALLVYGDKEKSLMNTLSFGFFGKPKPEEKTLVELVMSGEKILGKDAPPLTKSQKEELAYYAESFFRILLLGSLYIFMLWKYFPMLSSMINLGQKDTWKEFDGKDKITFADIAGQDEAKKELEEIVDFLKNPKKYSKLGAKVPRGVLLEGPPGTGKTLLARACANEANVPFLSISGSSFVEKFIGVGAARVRGFFAEAREKSPSICFIDEIDAVGGKRGLSLSNQEREQTINQLLSEMDGFKKSSVIVLAATNRADTLDDALTRPGRFDRLVTVGLPTSKGREDILRLHTKDMPLARNVSLDKIAKMSIGFSGADLHHICNEAALRAAIDNRTEISHSYFSQAFERKILGMKRASLDSYEDKKIVAYHEAGHALVGMLTPGADPVFKITITPRGQSLGVTAFTPKETSNHSRKWLLARICVLLGGRAAEEIMFKDVTVGAADDLRHVTSLATKIVTQFGMGTSVGQLNYLDNANEGRMPGSSNRMYSEATASEIDKEVQELVRKLYKRTKKLLLSNLGDLKKLAKALLEKEVLEADEVEKLLGL